MVPTKEEIRNVRKTLVQKTRNEYAATKIQSIARGRMVRREAKTTDSQALESTQEVSSEPTKVVRGQEDTGFITEDAHRGAQMSNQVEMEPPQEQQEATRVHASEPEDAMTGGDDESDVDHEEINDERDIAARLRQEEEDIERTAPTPAKPWPPSFITEELDAPDWPSLDTDNTQSVQDWIKETGQLKMRAVTWNLEAKPPPAVEETHKKLLPRNKYHLVVIGSEECERTIQMSALLPGKGRWEAYMRSVMGPRYVPVRSQTLQAIHIIVFVHVGIAELITDIRSAKVKTGFGGVMGNKGAVSISLCVAGHAFLFTNCHLAAHQHAVSRRNEEYGHIDTALPAKLKASRVRRARAGASADADAAVVDLSATLDLAQEGTSLDQSIADLTRDGDGDGNGNGDAGARTDAGPSPSGNSSTPEQSRPAEQGKGVDTAAESAHLARVYNYVICMGDFNYRIRDSKENVEKLMDRGAIESLHKKDQLRWSQEQGLSFQAMTEAPLRFKPTYKFDENSDVYDSGPKQRVPSWTDRILFRSGRGISCTAYDADFTLRTSDHRPVYASFECSMRLTGQEETFDDPGAMFDKMSQVCSVM